jgi:hypothetical protein
MPYRNPGVCNDGDFEIKSYSEYIMSAWHKYLCKARKHRYRKPLEIHSCYSVQETVNSEIGGEVWLKISCS